MNRSSVPLDALPDPDSDPTLYERLAALADGELSPAAAAQMSEWLREHPESTDDFRAQHEFGPSSDLMRLSRAPLPSSVAWDRAFAEIAVAVLAAPGSSVRPSAVPTRPADDHFRAPRWMLLTATTGIAACVALLVGLGLNAPNRLPDGGSVDRFLPDDERIVLAMNDEIEFHSLPEDARAYLPLGRYPISGAIVLANASEVEHHRSEPITGSPPARLDVPGEASETPLIWIPPHQP